MRAVTIAAELVVLLVVARPARSREPDERPEKRLDVPGARRDPRSAR
jgi:hypothetical protein